MRRTAPAAAVLQAFFFDVLLVDDEDLVDRPLVERLGVLDTIAPDCVCLALTTADPEAAEGSRSTPSPPVTRA